MQKYLYNDLYRLEDTHWWHKSKRSLASFLLSQSLRKKSGNKLLDVGCGTGRNIIHFSDFGKVYGIDSSSNAIELCRKRGISTLIKGNIEKIDMKGNSFDVITMLDVLEHTDEDKTLKKCHLLLKNGGKIIITVPAFNFLWSRWDEVLCHKRRYTSKSLEKVLKENNFKIIKTGYFFSYLFLPAFIFRKIKSKKKDYGSDFKATPAFLNPIISSVGKAELFFTKYVKIPFGTTVYCLAEKNEKN